MAYCHDIAIKHKKFLSIGIAIVMWANPIFTFFWILKASLQPCSNPTNLIFALINTIFSAIIAISGAGWKSGHTFGAFAVSFVFNFIGILVHAYKLL